MRNCSFLPKCALLLVLGLSACSSGGGTAPALAQGNLLVTSLDLVSPDPTSAHELDLLTGIYSTLETANVAISYYLIHKGDMDNGTLEPRQFLVQTHVLDLVAAGASKHSITILIPAEVGPQGPYYLTTRIDPLDQIAETDETDNVPPEDEPDIVININHANLNTPDFIIERVDLDEPAIVLSKNLSRLKVGTLVDRPDHHAGATAEFKVTGKKEFGAVSVQAKIELPGAGFRTIQIWREDQNQYVSTFYANITPGEGNSVHVDMNIPERLRLLLLEQVRAGQTQSKIQLTLNVGDSIREWENGVLRFVGRPDDMVTLPVTLVDPDPVAPPPCVSKTQDFKKVWKNRYIGSGIEFHAGAYIDNRGVVAEVEGALPIFLFNKRLEFFHGEAYGQLSPHQPSETQFHIDVDILGITVYQRASRDPDYTYTDTPFSKVETVERQSVVFAGPVPVVFKAGAQGVLGYKLEFSMDSGSMALTGTPYCVLTARGSATVHLGVAKAGLRGTMTLVKDDYATRVSFGNVVLLRGGSQISASLNTTVTNTLVGPAGRLYLFADYPGVKYCKTLAGRLPCGVRMHHKEKTLVKFRSFKKVDVLLNHTANYAIDLNCQ